jgi:hypothetical protein
MARAPCFDAFPTHNLTPSSRAALLRVAQPSSIDRQSDAPLPPQRWGIRRRLRGVSLSTMAGDSIREILLDLPLLDVDDRPAGMIVIRRTDVPEARREEADAWVVEHGGLIGHAPLIVVHGGKSPNGSPPGEAYYALPPAALVQ